MNPHRIAYSVDHDGPCAVERSVTFHERSNDERPAFARYRLQWTDANGCRHIVRYEVELADGITEQHPPKKYSERVNHYNVKREAA
jgi:hypothetical protein